MSESENMVVCPKCGGKNPADSRFCGYCGAPIPLETVSEPEKPQEPAMEPEKPQESEENREIIPEVAEPAETAVSETETKEPEPSAADVNETAVQQMNAAEESAEEDAVPAEEEITLTMNTAENTAEEDTAEPAEEPEAPAVIETEETVIEPEIETTEPVEPEPVKMAEEMTEVREARVMDAEFEMKRQEEKPAEEPIAAAPEEKKIRKPKIKADFSKSPLKKSDFSAILSSLKDPLKELPFTTAQSILSLAVTLFANMFLFTGILRAVAKKMINTFGLYAEIAGYGSFLGEGSEAIYDVTSFVRFADRFMSGLLFTLIMIALMAAASAFGQYRETKKIDAKETIASAARSLAAPALLVLCGSILAGFLPTIAMMLYLAAFVTSIMSIHDKLPKSWNGWVRIIMIVLIAGIVLWAGADGFIRVFLSTASQFAAAAGRMFPFR